MATPQLSIVTAGVETAGERIRRLQEEARLAAVEQMVALEQQMNALSALAREIVDGGDVFPVGVRELCRGMAEETGARLQTMHVILQRARAAH